MSVRPLSKFLKAAVLALLIAQSVTLAPGRASSVINPSSMIPYRCDAIKTILSPLSGVAAYSGATIRVSLNGLGQLTKSAIVISTGSKDNDEKILAIVNAIKFEPMFFACAIDDDMTLTIPISHGVPSADGIQVAEGEGFSFISGDTKIFLGESTPSTNEIVKQAQYLPEDMKYDKEIEALYRNRVDSVLHFDSYEFRQANMPMTDIAEHQARAENALKQGNTLEAVNEYILASTEPMFCGNFEKAKPLFDKAIELSNQLKETELRYMIESLTNYARPLAGPREISRHLKDADYVLSQAKKLSCGILAEHDKAWLPLLKVSATIHTEQKNFSGAESEYKRLIGLELAQPKPDRNNLENYYYSLANIYERQGEYKELTALRAEQLNRLRDKMDAGSLGLIAPISELARAMLKQNPAADVTVQINEVLGIAEQFVPPADNDGDISRSGEQTYGRAMVTLAEDLESANLKTEDSPAKQVHLSQAETLLKAAYKLVIKVTGHPQAGSWPLDHLCQFLERHGKAQEAVVLCQGAIKEIKERKSAINGLPRADLGLPNFSWLYVRALKAVGRAEDASRLEAEIKIGDHEQSNQRLKHLEDDVELARQNQSREPEKYLQARLKLLTVLLDRNSNLDQVRPLFQQCFSDYSHLHKDGSAQTRSEIYRCAAILANKSSQKQDRKLLFQGLEMIEVKRSRSKIPAQSHEHNSVTILLYSQLFKDNQEEFATFMRRILKLRQNRLQGENTGPTDLTSSLAGLDTQLGNFKEAEDLSKRLLVIYQGRKPQVANQIATQLLAVAEAAVRNQDFKGASHYRERAVDLAEQERESCPSKLDITPGLTSLAKAYVDEGRMTDAQETLSRAFSMMPPNRGNDDTHTRLASGVIIHCMKTGHIADVRNFLNLAIDYEAKSSGPDSIPVNEYRVDLAEVCLREAQPLPDGAIKIAQVELSKSTFEKAAQSYLASEGQKSPHLASAVRRRLLLLTIYGMSKDAADLQEKYKEAAANSKGSSSLTIN